MHRKGLLLFYGNKYSLSISPLFLNQLISPLWPLKVFFIVFFNPFKVLFWYKYNMGLKDILCSIKPINKKKSLTDYSIKLSLIKKAATYSPALHCSTIGASGLNFSVRNGKRWNTTAITAWYFFITSITYLQAKCMIK